MQMQDPSQGVPRDLLPHCHLVSSYRFPQAQHVPTEQIVKWLQAAPKISRENSPFFWTYLDRPADGNIFLVWQPLSVLGPNSASDGFMWAGAELAWQTEIPGGLVLETYHFRTGFAPGEPIATHARKRYRLLSRNPLPDVAQPDPSLFIVHYSVCDTNDRMPAQAIPINMQVQQVMQTRNWLQSQGQIIRKEFMLHDRANWPQISMPPGPGRGMPARPHGYPPARIPQNVAYPPQAMQYPAHQSNKRPRPNPPGPTGVPAAVPAIENGIEDEEDTLRGDLLDQITPREISYCRYKQNHELMEEVFSSPFHTSQIEPVDLGLGKPGSLNKLTEGIYEIPKYEVKKPVVPDPKSKRLFPELDTQHDYYDPPKLYAKSSYTAELDPEKAEEFRKRNAEHVEQTNKEIERMKKRHEKRMARFKAGSVITAGEKKLRSAVTDPDDVGTEFWRLEGRIDTEDDSMGVESHSGRMETKLKVADIIAEVEASLGKTAAVVKEVKRIQDGGLEERQAPLPAEPSASMGNPPARESQNGSQNGSGAYVGDTDMGMDDDGGQAAGLLDQFHHTGEAGSASAFSTHSTPAQSFSTPQLQHQSVAGTPSALGNVSAASPQQGAAQGQEQQSTSGQQSFTGTSGMGMDIEMVDAPEQRQGAAAEGSAAGTDEWIVVPPGGVSPSRNNTAQEAGNSNTNTTNTNENPAKAETSNTETPSIQAPDSSAANMGEGVDTSSFDFPEEVGGDLDLGMDLGMDDSAFGEAFHGVEGARDADDHGDM